jgi:hypothetical protein
MVVRDRLYEFGLDQAGSALESIPDVLTGGLPAHDQGSCIVPRQKVARVQTSIRTIARRRRFVLSVLPQSNPHSSCRDELASAWSQAQG